MKLSELKQIIRECLDDLEYSQHPKNLPIPYEKKLKKVRKDMTNRFPYDTSYEVGKQSNYRDIPKDDANFEKFKGKLPK